MARLCAHVNSVQSVQLRLVYCTLFFSDVSRYGWDLWTTHDAHVYSSVHVRDHVGRACPCALAYSCTCTPIAQCLTSTCQQPSSCSLGHCTRLVHAAIRPQQARAAVRARHRQQRPGLLWYTHTRHAHAQRCMHHSIQHTHARHNRACITPSVC